MLVKEINQPCELAIFDMDETLIANDLSMLWHQFLVEELGLVDKEFLEEDKRMMALYYEGKMDLDAYIAFSLSPLDGYSALEIDAMADNYVQSSASKYIYPQAKVLLEELKQKGITCMIISASVTFLVKAMARYLRLSHAEGVDLVIKDGCYTGKIQGTPSYQDGKVIRLEQWVERRGEQYAPIHFYSDSINDLPLLLEVDYPVVVNGCERLRLEANKYGWQQLHWGIK
ncbi:HAD-IB family hydrolase [Photobacterium makurazakiensis]|uniref:HAD family hydrolase n=1 Tax=Photobacterium makurazakiensis TaxID=2910234 RepID=UPI003D12D2E2